MTTKRRMIQYKKRLQVMQSFAENNYVCMRIALNKDEHWRRSSEFFKRAMTEVRRLTAVINRPTVENLLLKTANTATVSVKTKRGAEVDEITVYVQVSHRIYDGKGATLLKALTLAVAEMERDQGHQEQ